MPAAALPAESTTTTTKKQNEKTEKKNVKETQNEKHKKRNATTAATQAAPPPPTAAATATAAVTATTINWQSVPLKKQLHRHTHTHANTYTCAVTCERAPQRRRERLRESVASSFNSISVLPCCTLSNVDVLQADSLCLSLVCLALLMFECALSTLRSLSLSCSAARRSAPAKPTHNKKPILLLKCLRLCLSFVFGFLLGSHLVLIV